jgi:hypothetical protein
MSSAASARANAIVESIARPVARIPAPTSATSESMPFSPSAARSTFRRYPKKKIRAAPAMIAMSEEICI